MTASTATVGVAPRSGDRFSRVCALLRFDDPELFAPRRKTVLSAFDAITQLDASQLRTIVRAQRPRVMLRSSGQTLALDGHLRAAFACVREEARQHGRLVALGQTWAGCNQLVALMTVRSPSATPVLASAVAGEVLCRLLDDLPERKVLSRDDEDLLRHAWRQAHPAPAYFRRRSASSA